MGLDRNKAMQLFGAESIVKIFEDFNFEMQNTILNTSFRKGAKILLDEASNNLNGSYKHIQNSLKSTYNKEHQTMYVGSLRWKGGHFAHIVEGGTVERFTKGKNGRKAHATGRIIGNSFWSKAVASTQNKVEDAISSEIILRFNKAVAKNNKI